MRSLPTINAKTVFVLVFCTAGFLVLDGYRIGIEAQSLSCIPYDTTIVRFKKPDSIKRGDLVALVTHGEMRGGFDGKPIGKMVIAVAGDHIQISHDQLYINNIKVLKPLDLVSALHKKPGSFDREFTVKPDQIMVAGTEPKSYDSRYWGPIPTSYVVGTINPLPFAKPSAHDLAQQTLGSLY